MINVAVLYYFYRRRFLHMFSHLFLSKEFFESFRLQKKKVSVEYLEIWHDFLLVNVDAKFNKLKVSIFHAFHKLA